MIHNYTVRDVRSSNRNKKEERERNDETNSIRDSVDDYEFNVNNNYIIYDINIVSCNDINNNNKECIDLILTLLSDTERSDGGNNDHDCTVHNKDDSDNCNVLITYGNCFLLDTRIIDTNVLIIDRSVLTLLSKLLILLSELSKCNNDNDVGDNNKGAKDSNHYKFVSRKDDDINDNSKTDNGECTDNNNCNISSTDNGNSNSNDSDNNIKMCIDCNDDIMKNMKNKNKININNTTITSSDDNSDINTAQPRLFMASVGTQLSCLVLKMESLIVLATCIIRYKYDTILEALFVFHCSILYRIFTIDGEYQNLQRPGS